jgi:hypothetical protein
MAGQTTNYLFDYPTSTDYVKDGATAIQTLATDVDTTLFTALGGAYPGLRLVKKQTIGSAVSAITVTGAFSSTYDNYLVFVNGGTPTNGTNVLLTLGSTATGYYSSGFYIVYSSTSLVGINTNNGSSWPNAARGEASGTLMGQFTLSQPNLAKRTGIIIDGMEPVVGGAMLKLGGFLDNNTQYTAFTLTLTSGTVTGGTIAVYGYGTS